MTQPTKDDIEICLRIFHGDGPYGWPLLKQQWPEAAIAEQCRKMGAVIEFLSADKGIVSGKR